MSLWRRFFRKGRAGPSIVRPSSLKEYYQTKIKIYSEILAASNTALETLAQMQVRQHSGDYFSPAYVSLNCAVVLDTTQRIGQLLKSFAPQRGAGLAEKFAHIAEQIRLELTGLVSDSAAMLPFEKHLIDGTELLASGVCYPVREENPTEALNIKAVWGWWPALQGGTVHARRYQVAHGVVTQLNQPDNARQERWLKYHPVQGFLMEPLPPSLQGQPCLQEAEAQRIADYYCLLKEHFPLLEEVEWCLGANREIIFLRGRPAPEAHMPSLGEGDKETAQLFSLPGLTIYPGVASGLAFRLDVDHPTEQGQLPEGAVLLANKPGLALIPLLDKARALVVETGQIHNHLAFVIRSRCLPAVFDAGEAASLIPEGLNITVDAWHQQVLLGSREIPTRVKREEPSFRFLATELLTRLSPRLFSLNVAGSGETPAVEACQSVHDLLYLAGELRRKEMFCLSLTGEVKKKEAVSLVTGRLVPILIIDAGGGLAAEGPTVDYEAVVSLPFRAFLAGMMSIPWPKARPLDVRGFISVVGTTSITPRAEDQLRRISLALLSENYMNFSLCLGYHASTIEAHVSPCNLDDNYIRFHYEGGAASLERRLRRLQLIGEILARLGFKVTTQGDLLDAIATGDPEPRLLGKMEVLGRLEVYTKQMDMIMSDDTAISAHVNDFLGKHGNF
ncbi:MAG: hypothetical protein JRI66_09510 [Deltaproteobacteria bacterium]|nr:hypothetical protein [Deltaproteobacteria bacterium]